MYKDMAGLLKPYTLWIEKALKENVDLLCSCMPIVQPPSSYEPILKLLKWSRYSWYLIIGITLRRKEVDNLLRNLLVATLAKLPIITGLILNYWLKLTSILKNKGKNIADKLVHPGYAEILQYQIPGGMLSNFYVSLKAMKLEHKIEEAFGEVPEFKSCTGYPPLVTTTSQIVGYPTTWMFFHLKVLGRW